ncbi:DEAD/DEAH box helicase [Devosia aurantiaca]|uniref:DEAD/DEAH box helicase n=1 Tax=Devosia aurantiaca TaxID=2714858 RepID=A0A6M1SX27_9HYPH|nr:DEAD/DEAH box helicase [Devosia aurantiaca]NGP18863.1 DEAD/DEAH box helicase [Devosia aurantiaca]
MAFSLTYDAHFVSLHLESGGGLLQRLIGRKPQDLDQLPPSDRELIYAIADLRALADEAGEPLEIAGQQIRMSHRLAAAVTSQTAEALNFPPIIDLTFRTDVEGVIGSPSFRLRHEWTKAGQRQLPKRTGAIMTTSDGDRRVPLWLLEAVEVAEHFQPGGQDDAAHWEALARFRQALDPGVRVAGADHTAKVSMTDFLSGLSVNLADRFSISPNSDGTDFNVVPFSGKTLERGRMEEAATPFEAQGELQDRDLLTFQQRVRDRGALPAYRVAPGSYLVIDRSASPVLEVMAKMQKAMPSERQNFIRNPRPAITAAVEDALRRDGKLDGLDPVGEEEAIEAIAGPALVETHEFSERVVGIKIFEKRAAPIDFEASTWMPEDFGRKFAELLADMPSSALDDLRVAIASAIESGVAQVQVDDLAVPARAETLTTIDKHIADRADLPEHDDLPDAQTGPIVLETEDNTDELHWIASLTPRAPAIGTSVPTIVKTALKPHQVDSLAWQIDAWTAGLPGVLNADEQGLGKTLQTIAFLAWIQEHMKQSGRAASRPILVVAPTSLLVNWEQEVSGHLQNPGLGSVIRLYGAGTGSRKVTGARGMDIDDGVAKLDLSSLHEAIEEGRAHRQWILTTYTTLTNYQHSLAQIPFAAVVFDEIQAIKNPFSMRAEAARTINADFRIGLTGTPIENSAQDLWSIMDQLTPGSLDSLGEFRRAYSETTPQNMAQLHSRVFMPSGKVPPLALRRLKQAVASDLPEKTRQLHPRQMPRQQAESYEDAKLKLAQGGSGAALKMLHHIRSVSVHPDPQVIAANEDMIAASARLEATFDILRTIKNKQERALVFIEDRQMQYRFIELVKAEFGFARVDLINGDTPIKKRQEIVNRFQMYRDAPGFDLLVLGPKAAGTGLTLTAATHVIHLSRWWNPAVEEQCNDRVHRIGQTRPVSVHVPMSIHPGFREHSFDCLLHSLMQRKRRLATSALWPMGDTEADAGDLQRMVADGVTSSGGDAVMSAMTAMFQRDNIPVPALRADGSLPFD